MYFFAQYKSLFHKYKSYRPVDLTLNSPQHHNNFHVKLLNGFNYVINYGSLGKTRKKKKKKGTAFINYFDLQMIASTQCFCNPQLKAEIFQKVSS